ncbi:MAG: ferredoxin [Clostridiales Family XIII bacterium]|jgi:hypothetical protein|nr:ferredoxin [Clostridiales Family XIII bacterium]
MKAHYGYEDGSGSYYITVNTEYCATCDGKPCTDACVQGIFAREEDDFDDEIVVVREDARNSLKSICAACKPQIGGSRSLPCEVSCKQGMIAHSW